jgi:cytochrome c5
MNLNAMLLATTLSFFLGACGNLLKKNQRSTEPGEELASGDAVAAGDQPIAPTPTQDPAPAPAPAPAVKPALALKGKDLYIKYCESCHGVFEKSEKGKTTRDMLDKAILSIPEMAELKTLTNAERDAIVLDLSAITPPKGKGKGK